MTHLTRRNLLIGAAALAATPALAAKGFVDYRPGLIDELLSNGQVVFVDYAADWCSTCARQERVIQALLADNPAYAQAMTFVRVDWDAYRSDPVTTARQIPRRSTLLVLKGNQELGRLVAATSQSDIKALLDRGLAAAA
ncbi:MAG: thioredoxin family protein [Pseudomonadota bacterium]